MPLSGSGEILMKYRITIAIVAVLALLAGCSSAPKVTRTAADETTDLSGRWNDTDSRLTAEAMVQSMLSGVWLQNFMADNGRPPVLILGTVNNRSSEHIDSVTFTKAIERELVNSGMVELVADEDARVEVRDEKDDQQSNATMDTAAALAAETAADFMMQGVITSQTDAIDGKRATLYKVDMELTSIETQRKVWIDTKEIKKIVEQKKNSW